MDKQLLDRIRKCMALGRSSNEHEAAAALAKARALMEEHGISDADLALAELEEATARASRTQRPPRWESHLCHAVRRALGVDVILIGEGDRTYIGRGALPEIAAYAFSVLFRRLKAARAEYIKTQLKRCKPGRKRARADIFCEAWALAVYRKVAALAPEREPDPHFEQFLARRYPHAVTVMGRAAQIKGKGAWDDYSRGFSSGRSVELNNAVSGGTAPLAIG